MQKTDVESQKYTKNTMNMTMDMSIGNLVNVNSTGVIKEDYQKKLKYESSNTTTNGKEETEEIYTVDNIKYMRKDLGSWQKQSSEENNEEENNEEENNIVESNFKEVLNAGLVYSETDDSIILEGDVAPDLGAKADAKNDPDYVAHTVILIDKKTYLPKQMKFVIKGKMSIEDTKFPYSMNGLVDFDYSDFEIVLPPELETGNSEAVLV